MIKLPHAPSYGEMVPLTRSFNGSEPRLFDFDQDMPHVVKIEQAATYLPGGAWPMAVFLHLDDGEKIAWRGKLFGTVEHFCRDFADKIESAGDRIKNIPVTGEDGFRAPLFPERLNYQRSLGECHAAAIETKKVEDVLDAETDPKDWDSPKHRAGRGLRPHANARESYGSGERLMLGAEPASANDERYVTTVAVHTAEVKGP
jgi:hypothetical protein